MLTWRQNGRETLHLDSASSHVRIPTSHVSHHARLCWQQTQGTESGAEEQGILLGFCWSVHFALYGSGHGGSDSESQTDSEGKIRVHGGCGSTGEDLIFLRQVEEICADDDLAQWLLRNLCEAELGNGPQPRHHARLSDERREASTRSWKASSSGRARSDRRSEREVAEEVDYHGRAE